jgi:hypothetical protein
MTNQQQATGNQHLVFNGFLFFIPDIFMTVRYPETGAGFF